MLYENTKKLTDEVFKDPGAEYRGTPFWAWNTKMTKEKVDLMTEVFKDMGMGGAHLHSRIGLGNVYLGEEFMELIKKARENFKKNGMLTWLYDEDRWPSGSAGGFVTKDRHFRERFLVFTEEEKEDREKLKRERHYSSCAVPVRGDDNVLLAKYEIELKDGFLKSYRRLKENESARPGMKTRWAFLEVCGDNPWFNYQAYVNTLDKKAIDEFIRITHDKYYSELGDGFGKDIPAIFTDEPQFASKERLGFAEDSRTVKIPFSDDFEEDFTKRYGHSLLDSLPELFWEAGEGKYSVTRYEYHDFVCERFAESFADNIGDWCRKHNILMTGHMMEEPTLTSQTACLGEAMRSYRGFDIPGIDMLCDHREFTTAKQAQSAAHQKGAPGIMSELYGVTGYNFDFRGHKLQGDWQAALGVTVRVPHLTWTSMAGEAKRDYPASIGYQSPWYKEYKHVEDYFARINTALTRGKPVVKVGVIHPIESFWLLWGNEEQTGELRRQRDEEFQNLTSWLLLGSVDFDLISESLLAGFKNGVEDGKFVCGEMRYDAVVVPDLITIRKTTIDALKAFAEAGGKVIIAGRTPTHINAKPDDSLEKICTGFTKVGFDRYSILNALKDQKIVEIRDDRGNPVGNLIYQMRSEEECNWLFLAHAFRNEPVDIPHKDNLHICLKGMFKPVVYDALTGDIYEIPFRAENGRTFIEKEFFDHDSLLLKLVPLKEEAAAFAKPADECRPGGESLSLEVPENVKIELAEPNVLLLDMAEYRIGDEEFGKKEEILRIDNILREKAGGTVRQHAYPQPWAMDDGFEYTRDLTLRYSFESEIEGTELSLGIEKPENYELIFNDRAVEMKKEGFFVDRDIDRIALGVLKKGRNELILKTLSGKIKELEALYVLGDFGVRLKGSKAVIVEKPEILGFGDISRQDLPFYSGNLSYIWDIELGNDGDLLVRATDFRCPLIKVELDGKDAGNIAFSPYECLIRGVKRGKHEIRLTAFGNRNNTFSPLHLCDRQYRHQDPDSWRTVGASWSYEYKPDPFGILKRPELFKIPS